MHEHIGEAFQELTKYRREAMQSRFDPTARPAPFKEYPNKPVVQLPEPTTVKPAPFRQAIGRRCSVRAYKAQPLSVDRLSFLLWAAGGPRCRESGLLKRTVPSAGGLYPIETYLVVNAVDGLEPGIYHYAVRTHALERIVDGKRGDALAHAALEQSQCRNAPVVFIWSAVFGRTLWKYGQRGMRYVYLDAGHIAHAVALAATSLGFGTCQMAALFDDEVNALLGLDGQEESVIYMSSVGRPV